VSGRQILATLLAVVAAGSAVLGASAWWARDAVIAHDAFVDRAVTALDREPVRAAVSDEITGQVVSRLPAGTMSRAAVRRIVDRSMRTRAFRRAFRSGASAVDDALFSSGAGSGSATLRVDLADVLGQVSPQLAAVVAAGGGTSVELATISRDSLPIDTSRAADLVRTLAVVLPALACFALAGALAVATDRRRALASAALAAMVCGGLLLAGLFAGHAAVQGAAQAGNGVGRARARSAAGAVWDVYTSGVRTTAIVTLVAGLVVGIATLAPWGRRASRPASRAGGPSR
jgi:hypothetical protein